MAMTVVALWKDNNHTPGKTNPLILAGTPTPTSLLIEFVVRMPLDGRVYIQWAGVRVGLRRRALVCGGWIVLQEGVFLWAGEWVGERAYMRVDGRVSGRADGKEGLWVSSPTFTLAGGLTGSGLESDHRRIRRWGVGKHADEQMDKRVGTSVKLGRLAVGKRKHERIGRSVCRRAGGTWLWERTDGWWTARRVGDGPACQMAGRHFGGRERE